MKSLGLPCALLVATLFLTPGAPAQPPAGGMMRPGAAGDLLKRLDKNGDGKIDDEERIAAREATFEEEMNRQAGRGNTRPPDGGPQPLRARMMEMFDQDRDGRLEGLERLSARRYAEERGLGENGEIRQEVFRRFDRNGDNRLDDAERTALEAFQLRRVEGLMELRTLALQTFDRNGDARLEGAEQADFEAELRRRLEQDPARLAGVDANGDGRLDDGEWTAAREQVRTWLALVGDEMQRRRVQRAANPEAAARAPVSPEEQANLDRVAEEMRQRRRQQLQDGAGAPEEMMAK